MIMLSMTLPARANRMLNLFVPSLYIPVSVFNAVGESWFVFYGLGIVVEVLLLAFILRSAWTWPRRQSPVKSDMGFPCPEQVLASGRGVAERSYGN